MHWDYENDPVPFFGICGLPVSGLFEAPPRGEKVRIWLASYPRSGNTLLRTMLKQSMDMDSYSDGATTKSIGFSKTSNASFGHLDYAGSWDSFYDLATTSDAIFFGSKTHLPPRDQQPVIHVVRDGRRSIFSYWRYHQVRFRAFRRPLGSGARCRLLRRLVLNTTKLGMTVHESVCYCAMRIL